MSNIEQGQQPQQVTPQQEAELAVRKMRAEDANLVAAEVTIYGEVRSEQGIEAAARLCGWLIEELGFTP